MAEEVTGVLGKTVAGSEKQKPKEETKERVPESYIAMIKARPLRKIPPLSERLFANNPRRREIMEAAIAHVNCMVDMQQDCLRQHAEKGHAEVGVDFKKLFSLPNQSA